MLRTRGLAAALLLLLVLPSAGATRAYTAVSDDAALLDANAKAMITETGTRLYDAGTCQYMVKVVAEAEDLEKESLKFFRDIGLGDAKLNNGLLVYVNAEGVRKNKKPRLRVEVGYGLEGILSDGKCGRLMDEAMAVGKDDFNVVITTLTASLSSELGKADVPKVLVDRKLAKAQANKYKLLVCVILVGVYLICLGVAPAPTLRFTEIILRVLMLVLCAVGKGGGRGLGGGSCGGGGASR